MFVSRRRARAMLRPHLTPIAAILLAVEDGHRPLGNVLYGNQPLLKSKIDATSASALWTESVRTWVAAQRSKSTTFPVRVHDPYQWVELKVHSLHVRLVRDDSSIPHSERQRRRSQQIPDGPLAPLYLPGLQPEPVSITAVDIRAVRNSAGHVIAVIACPPPDGPHLWEPITADLKAARRMLAGWRRRGTAPWLASAQNAGSLATAHARAARVAAVESENVALRKKVETLVAAAATTPITSATTGTRAARFRIPRNPETGSGENASG